MPTSAQIREQITQKLIDALEHQTIPWRRPWSISPNAGCPMNIVSHKLYSGINPLLLRLHQLEHNLQSRWYGTFDQIQALGGMVRRRPDNVPPGHWGCQIVFYRPVTKTVTNEDTGQEEEERYSVLRTYTVFCVDQCDGALDRFKVQDEPTSPTVMPNYEPAENLIQASGADIRYGGDQAFYHTDGDFIQVPNRNRFVNLGAWYETILHEMAHWSEIRIDFPRKEQGYAFGELYAEIASSFVCTELGVPQGEDLANHAAYLRNWLDAMKGDSSFVFRASTWASKAAEYLLAFAKVGEPVAAGREA